MPQHTKCGEPEKYRRQLVSLLENFEECLHHGDLRAQVLALLPASKLLRNLGCSLIRGEHANGARSRILAYFRKYVGVIISSEELMIVAGIAEYARRIRELRVQFGWPIISGMSLNNMGDEELESLFGDTPPKLKSDQYILVIDQEDRDAAFRWNLANEIRRSNLPIHDKILEYFRKNIGKKISSEELRYVSGNKTEWARRVRELRTEKGWPIATQVNGRPDLPMGIYVLEKDRQGPEHDRKIPDSIYRGVLRRDNYTCCQCKWNKNIENASDTRHLEVHHIKHHVAGGENTEDNLITLCNICHDAVHREK